MNNRRKLLVALGASVIAAPHASFAQQPGKVWRVGFLALRGRPDSLDSGNHGAFRQGMRELGYVEGGNLVIEWRFAEERSERLTDLAAELILGKVDVIVTTSAPTTQAAQKATAKIPIVMGGHRRPRQQWLCQKPGAPGRQYHRPFDHNCRPRPQVYGNAAQHGSQTIPRGGADRPLQLRPYRHSESRGSRGLKRSA
jgi:hypothetical protein